MIRDNGGYVVPENLDEGMLAYIDIHEGTNLPEELILVCLRKEVYAGRAGKK